MSEIVITFAGNPWQCGGGAYQGGDQGEGGGSVISTLDITLYITQVLGRVTEALKHIPKERLILAPDCGLGMLPPDIIRQKLAVIRGVASQF